VGTRAGFLALVVMFCTSVVVPACVPASSSRVLREHVELKLVHKSGTHFRHRGTATGTVRGTVTSAITLESLSISGTVSVRTKSGTARLRVKGTARSGGLRSRFEGRATVVGGTGRYGHARGGGTFHGVVNRSTWAATIDASGTLSL
jgi:hypothetical protein